MVRTIFFLLLIAYISYSAIVYVAGSKPAEKPSEQVIEGFSIWQSRNCQSCHQFYGLGGYMGPDLTNIISDPAKGPLYAKGFILAGTPRMPNFQFTESEAASLVAFLTWVDKSGRSLVPRESVTPMGNYRIDTK